MAALAVISNLALDHMWRQRIGNDALGPLLGNVTEKSVEFFIARLFVCIFVCPFYVFVCCLFMYYLAMCNYSVCVL